MNLTIPENLPHNEVKFRVMYEGRGIGDRGVSMERVIRSREPYGIFNLETGELTSLQDGSKRMVRALDTGTYHSADFRDAESTISFVRDRYPRLNLEPVESY